MGREFVDDFKHIPPTIFSPLLLIYLDLDRLDGFIPKMLLSVID